MSKVLFLISPTLNSFVDKRKGTTGNKIDCATKHCANAIVTHTGAAAAIAGAGFAGKLVTQNLAKKSSAAAASLEQMGGLKKALTYLQNSPKPVKIIAGAFVGLMALMYSYKAGKIEQKYLDRAQFVDHTFNLDGEGVKNSTKTVK